MCLMITYKVVLMSISSIFDHYFWYNWDMKYTLHIIRKPVKHLRLRVLDGQNIQAIAPKKMPETKIQDFVSQKKWWISKQLQKYKEAESQFELWANQILLHGEPYTCIRREWQGTTYTLDHKSKFLWWWYNVLDVQNTLHRYKTYAKYRLTPRLELLAKKHGIEYNKIFIRDQKTKWWTCSSEWNIWLNWRLIKMPVRVADYVIIHELAHRKIMNHSSEFREYLTELYPKTPEARKWLKQYGRALH